MAKKKVATTKTVKTTVVDTPEVEVVEVKTPVVVIEEKPEVRERSYDELVLLPREEFLKVQADVRAWRARFKPQ